MNYLKAFLIFILLIIVVPIGLFLGLKSLPNSIQYHSEIKYGNLYVEKLLQYKERHGELPESTDYDILYELNPEPSKEFFYPQYNKIDKNNFYLTYIIGVDGPYFSYNTFDREWKLE